MKPKKIIITGSTGKISSYLLGNLSLQGTMINGISRKKFYNTKRVKNFNGSFYDDFFLENSLNNTHTIIHALALTRATNKKQLYHSNEYITKKIVKFCEKNNTKRFIFLSTDLAHNPAGNYGKSKLACEKIIENSNLKDWVILRLSPVIFSYDGDERTTFGKIFKSIENERFIFLPNSGKFSVSPLLAKDLLELIKILFNFKGTIKEIFSVTGKEYILHELIAYLSLKNKKKSKVIGVSIKFIKYIIKFFLIFNISLPVFESLTHLFQNNKISNQKISKKFNFKPSRLY